MLTPQKCSYAGNATHCWLWVFWSIERRARCTEQLRWAECASQWEAWQSYGGQSESRGPNVQLLLQPIAQLPKLLSRGQTVSVASQINHASMFQVFIFYHTWSITRCKSLLSSPFRNALSHFLDLDWKEVDEALNIFILTGQVQWIVLTSFRTKWLSTILDGCTLYNTFTVLW